MQQITLDKHDTSKDIREGRTPERLSPQIELFLRLIASAVPLEEAYKQVNISKGYAQSILRSPAGEAYLQSLSCILDLEFQGLYSEVVECVRTGLKHSDPQVYLSAASLWLKTNKNKVTIELSAEDIVKKLIEGVDEENDKT